MNCGCNGMSREQCDLLKDISVLGFFVVDMSLFVDTHPEDENAQDYLSHYAKLLREMKKEYAQQYGALSTEDAALYGVNWDWESMPLPWEGGCN